MCHRCRENHAKLELEIPPNPVDLIDQFANVPNDELVEAHPAANDDNNILPPPPPLAVSSEVLLMINGADLPSSLEQLEIFRFPILTRDLHSMVAFNRLPNIRKLFLHECGKTGEFGVDASVLIEMGGLSRLKFLEVIGFNDRGGERRSELEQVFQTIGLPYEGQETWLEFSDGSSCAHDSLKVLSQYQGQSGPTYHELK